MSKLNIERLFYEDIRDKKRTGRGAFHKKGKGVKHNMRGIKTPYDFMKTKERKKLNGECVTSNMYETIIAKEEFDLKDDKTKKAMLTKWRELYSNQKIMKEMGITGQGTFAKYISELDIPKKVRGGYKKSKAKTNEVEIPTVKLLSSGLHLEYNGCYNSEQLTKIFTKLQLLIDGEENDFNINISITEK